MSRKTSRSFSERIAWLGVTLACGVVMLPSAFLAKSLPEAAQAPRRPSRSEHLRQWLAAIERHQPGTDDDAIRIFGSWRLDDFQYLAIDVNTLLAVMTDHSLRTFFRRDSRGRSVQQVYSGSDLNLIVELATAAAARKGDDGNLKPSERLQRNKNRILKRGAILHTDAALEAFAGGGPKNRSAPEPLRQVTLFMPDGRQAGVDTDIGHLEIARGLLDGVVPSPGRDDFVRRWYASTGEFLLGIGHLSPPHFGRALRVVEDNADLLFLAGCLHETLAEPSVQEVMQNASVPDGVTFDVASRRAELGMAESLLRKALKLKPGHVEARIHLGRILSLHGEHAEAESVLRQAVAEVMEPVLQYYARLFLAGELEALGNRAMARQMYMGASAVYPDAQSPRLALSLMSTNDGDVAAALDPIATVLAAPAESRADPWWTYHRSVSRNALDDLKRAYGGFVEDDLR